VAGKVELLVPAPEGDAVAVEEFDLRGFELNAVRGQGGGEIGMVGGWRWGLVHEVLLTLCKGLGITQYRGK